MRRRRVPVRGDGTPTGQGLAINQTYPPILDANGAEVLPVSEWMNAKSADIDLIIEAVNAWNASR